MFAVDDDLEASAKHEALDELPPERRARAFEAWLRLGAACRKRGNGGAVTPSLLAKILHAWKPAERNRAALDLVEARGGREHGLWVADGAAFRFYAWEEWQPGEEEATEEREHLSKKTLRQRRWRHKKRLGVDAEPETKASTEASTVDASPPSTEASTVDASDASRALRAPATRAPDPVPSRPLPSGSFPDSSSATSISESDRVRDPQLALVAWTQVLGEAGCPFEPHPTRDAPTFRAIAALVGKLTVDSGAPLADHLRASAKAHLAQRTSGKSLPGYWLEWLQREASAGPKAASRTPDRDRYRPAGEWEAPAAPDNVVPIGTAAASALAALRGGGT